ncbi:uncharacterized protein A4U43_C07F29540 [Asparagus officinalis]|uniref:Uncharacterized protein n=1 Tax=Asparagus officinalis TaxID=4686 RepID=A0A5P1EFT1_ASPOF|nr:uncharacterized protein A4U43_C07F29540 [Asparagus officinalis]
MTPKTAVDRSKSKGKKIADSSHEPDSYSILLHFLNMAILERMAYDTDAPLESINREPIVKPVLLFGDSSEDPDLLDIGTYEWLRTVNG